VRLEALEAVEAAEDGARAGDDDGVVDETIPTPRLGGAVAAEAGDVEAGVRALLDEQVADDVGVLAHHALGAALGADQLQLVVVGALDPL
jgi:hypothetical protein